MKETHAKSTHGTTSKVSRASSEIVVSVVTVPPRGKPKAYGHTLAGACVEFTNAAGPMLALFHRLRNAGREERPQAVIVNAGEWQAVREIPPAECPVHALPEIPPGSEVPFAPY